MQATITSNTGDTRTITNTYHGRTLIKMDLWDVIDELDAAGELANTKEAGRLAFLDWTERHAETAIEAPRLGRTANGGLTVINGRHRMLGLASRGYTEIYIEMAD